MNAKQRREISENMRRVLAECDARDSVPIVLLAINPQTQAAELMPCGIMPPELALDFMLSVATMSAMRPVAIIAPSHVNAEDN